MSLSSPAFTAPLASTIEALRTILARASSAHSSAPFHQRLSALRRRFARDIIPALQESGSHIVTLTTPKPKSTSWSISDPSHATSRSQSLSALSALATSLAESYNHVMPLLTFLVQLLSDLIKTGQMTALYVSLLTATCRIYYIMMIPPEKRKRKGRGAVDCVRDWLRAVGGIEGVEVGCVCKEFGEDKAAAG
ncbi:hypothetical protein TeGR_g12940, partial [Tetraparma gracilis]